MRKIVKKNQWTKPELKVLVRSSSEEAVLAGCKGHGSFFGDGPLGVDCIGWFPAQLCNSESTS